MKLMEVCSGIGGFTKGFIDAGHDIGEHYFSEIDKHAIANYKYNFPNAKYIGSVVDIRPEDFTDIDLFTGGFPCQPFSLAGKRLGFEDTRGNIFFEIIRILVGCKPKCVVLENVKGLLNHDNGRTFATVYRLLTEIGYTVECQLLNTKWFLPQNRERIYLVGHLAGSERSFGNVFPITENDCGINERAIETRSIRTLTAGGNSGGLHSSMTLIKSTNNKAYEEAYIGDSINFQNINSNTRRGRVGKGIAQTLDTECKQAVIQINSNTNWGNSVKQSDRVYSDKGLSPCLTSSMGTGGNLVPNINTNKFIRRLTEIECERLQGFPDNWTEFGNYDGVIKKVPKTQRYKMLGNAVTVKVVEEIVKRIKI
jgi:DNA (cytosine-5)-methyltransferase 1